MECLDDFGPCPRCSTCAGVKATKNERRLLHVEVWGSFQQSNQLLQRLSILEDNRYWFASRTHQYHRFLYLTLTTWLAITIFILNIHLDSRRIGFRFIHFPAGNHTFINQSAHFFWLSCRKPHLYEPKRSLTVFHFPAGHHTTFNFFRTVCFSLFVYPFDDVFFL